MTDDVKLANVPGINVWQGLSAALGGAILTAMLGVNMLTERSINTSKKVDDAMVQIEKLQKSVGDMGLKLAEVSADLRHVSDVQRDAKNVRK